MCIIHSRIWDALESIIHKDEKACVVFSMHSDSLYGQRRSWKKLSPKGVLHFKMSI
jgi:hypothetical protein